MPLTEEVPEVQKVNATLTNATPTGYAPHVDELPQEAEDAAAEEVEAEPIEQAKE